MLKLLIGIITTLVILLALYLTNPSLRRQKLLINQKASELMNEELTTRADSVSSVDQSSKMQEVARKQVILTKLLDKGMSRTNYLLFSTTNLEYDGQSSTIGYGIFGNVYLTASFEALLRSPSHLANTIPSPKT